VEALLSSGGVHALNVAQSQFPITLNHLRFSRTLGFSVLEIEERTMCFHLTILTTGSPLAAYDPRPQPWAEWQRQLPLDGWELLIFIVLAGLILFLVLRKREGTKAQQVSMELLKQRYARGDITQDQFYQMKRDIEKK
jgi:hypothetical protein